MYGTYLLWYFEYLFEKPDQSTLVCDACEFGKITISSYDSSGNRSSHAFDIIHADIWDRVL